MTKCVTGSGKKMRQSIWAVFVGGACVIAPSTALAQSVADFYRGKTVSIYTHTPTGSYDQSARLVARGLSRHLPGNPTVIIRQMLGANSLIAANHIYNVAAQDGTHIWAGARLAPFMSLFGIVENIRFDITKVHWLGSTASENSVVVASDKAPHRTAADLFRTELVVGATVPGADTYLYPHALNRIIGTKFKIISGYQSPAPIAIAIQQGEIQGNASWSWSNLVSTFPHLLAEKKVRVLMQLGLEKHPDLPDTPFVMDYAKGSQDREVLELLMGMRQYSYPFFVGPGVPADRAAALKAAFAATLKDPDFLADARKQGRPIGMATGDEVMKAYSRAYSLPKSSIDRVREVVQVKK
jgi:tripartite-type tricarboxylate transporter receptor subunit TctC